MVGVNPVLAEVESCANGTFEGDVAAGFLGHKMLPCTGADCREGEWLIPPTEFAVLLTPSRCTLHTPDFMFRSPSGSAHVVARSPDRGQFRFQAPALSVALLRIILESPDPRDRRVFLGCPPPFPVGVGQGLLGGPLPEQFLEVRFEPEFLSCLPAPGHKGVHHRRQPAGRLPLARAHCRQEQQLQRVGAVPVVMPRRRFIPARVEDNAFINPEYKTNLASRTGWQYDAWYLGRWNFCAGHQSPGRPAWPLRQP